MEAEVDWPCPACGVDVVVLLWLLVLLVLMLLLLELVLALLGAGGDLGVWFGEDGYYTDGDFVVDDRLVVLSHDVDFEFLYQHKRSDKADGMR
jgi:hypothetical protein